MASVKDSSDAFRLIHSSLAGWIEGTLQEGFPGNPVDLPTGHHFCDELILIAIRMREIEGHTDIEADDA